MTLSLISLPLAVNSLVHVALASVHTRRALPKIWEFSHRIQLVAGSRSIPTGVFYVEDHGADPSGHIDSTSAVQAAVNAANERVAAGAFEGGIPDRGGATVHLGGGEYLISDTVWLGKGGNVRFCCGSLRAAPTFPRQQAMLSADGGELVTIDNVLFDCNKSASGAVWFTNFLRAHLSQVYVVHFNGIGVHVTRGHEVHITDCFLGEYIWYENHPSPKTKTLSGTAIQIDGQDSWISESVIFSGLQGIVMNGGASTVTNTHIYNGGGPAMVLSGNSIRVLGSYMDFNPIIAIDPVAITVSDCFFLGGVGLEIRSGGTHSFVSGLIVARNHFVVGDAESPGPWIPVSINETAGPFIAINDTVITENTFPPATYGKYKGQSYQRRSTVVRRALRQESATHWTFNLNDELAFPKLGVEHVSHESVIHGSGFPTSVVRSVSRGVVEVEFSAAVTATVYLVARQGLGATSRGTEDSAVV